jgi:Tol biopolymer transport system component
MVRVKWFIAVAAVLVLMPGAGSAATRAAGVLVFAADRKPTDSGEIYRVGLDGKRVNLSRSAAFDAGPALSTDGRSVAFVSARGGHAAVYVVGTNGRNLKRISPLLSTNVPNQPPWAVISWAPDSRHLAALIGGPRSNLYLATLGHSWRVVPGTGDALNAGASWSPDGRFLSFTVARAGEVRVIDIAGRTAWTAPGESASWSARGRLAVQANSYTLTVYDETGHPLGSFPASMGAWSPNGDRLASLTPSRKMLELRAGGTGPATLRHPLSGERLGWLGANTVRSFGAHGWIGFDVVHARTVQLPGAYLPFNSVPYVDGTEAVAEPYGSGGASLIVTARVGGTHVVATAMRCPEEGAFSNEQFMPGGRFVIYATSCPAPPSDIYSISPDGTGLRRLTTSQYDDTQPALSPDGRTIAYVEKDNAVKCGGCTETMWVMNADGSAAHALPNAPDAADTPYDDSPTFSPDGLQLLFTRSGPNSQHLFTEPVAGGTAHDLGISASYPAWGPTRIAFGGDRVFTAAPNGTDQRAVTLAGRAVLGIPAWSSDGRVAVLLSNLQSVAIVVFDANGVGRRISFPALHSPYPTGPPAWSPDGTRLAFAGVDRDGVDNVWTVGADGHGLHRVTHDIGAVSSVAWR